MKYKFRGKWADNGEWVYGSLICLCDENCILPEGVSGTHHTADVTPESVGQFTGLTDKHGADIYEGDKISDHVGLGVVEYSNKVGAFCAVYPTGRTKYFDYVDGSEKRSIEIIGTIHDSPEAKA